MYAIFKQREGVFSPLYRVSLRNVSTRTKGHRKVSLAVCKQSVALPTQPRPFLLDRCSRLNSKSNAVAAFLCGISSSRARIRLLESLDAPYTLRHWSNTAKMLHLPFKPNTNASMIKTNPTMIENAKKTVRHVTGQAASGPSDNSPLSKSFSR